MPELRPERTRAPATPTCLYTVRVLLAVTTACAREELAPLALHAYPEAFLDFKKTLLMLVDTQQQRRPQQQQHAQQSPQQQPQQNKQEWSLEGRQQLAETLYHSMLLQMGECFDAKLC